MATTNNSYSDLIHLFIDGEATETERNTLFGALKDSPELQEEFHSAMELKKAFAADIMQLQPPTYLQSQIAERAGLIVAASASVATAPVVVNSISSGISSMLSSAAPVATTAISKGIIALAIGTSVGILSTIGVIKLTSNDSPKAVAPAVSQNITRPMVTAPSLVVPIKPEIQSAPEGTYKSNRTNTTTNTLRSAAPLITLNIANGSLNEKSNVISAESKDISAANKTPEVIPNNASNSVSQKNENPAEFITKSIPAIEPRLPASRAIGDHGANRESLHPDNFDMGTSGVSRWSLHVTGISTLQLNQGNKNVALPVWNNVSGGVKYDLDPTNAIAVEVGQETFPVYLDNGKGGFDEHRFITWVGGSWNYSLIWWEFVGVHPEIRGLLGGSNAGPIAKISAGLVLPISSRLSLSSNLEETGLFINVNGAPTVGTKLGVTASLRFHIF